MMSKPEEYEGKTIRIEGKYYASYYPITDKYYNYCLIADALACCSQGLEFELGGGAVYPGDYPADQSEVEYLKPTQRRLDRHFITAG